MHKIERRCWSSAASGNFHAFKRRGCIVSHHLVDSSNFEHGFHPSLPVVLPMAIYQEPPRRDQKVGERLSLETRKNLIQCHVEF